MELLPNELLQMIPLSWKENPGIFMAELFFLSQVSRAWRENSLFLASRQGIWDFQDHGFLFQDRESLELLGRMFPERKPKILREIIKHGSKSILLWWRSENRELRLENLLLKTAVLARRPEMLELLFSLGLELQGSLKKAEFFSFTIQALVPVRVNELRILALLRDAGAKVDERKACALAARAGDLKLLRWFRGARVKGFRRRVPCFSWDERVCREAEAGEHLSLLYWALGKGAPRNPRV